MLPVIRELGRRRRADQRRHHARRGRRGGDRGRRGRWSTTSAAGSPTRTWPSWSPRPASRGCSCTGAATAGRCTRRRATATSSPRSAPSSPPGWRTSSPSGVAPEQLVLDPGLGFAKNADHNWALLAGPRPARRPGPAGARRRVPQDVPRPAAAPTPTASRARPSGGTPRRWPPPCSLPRPGRGGSACTTPPPRSTPSAPSRPSEPPEEPAVAEPCRPGPRPHRRRDGARGAPTPTTASTPSSGEQRADVQRATPCSRSTPRPLPRPTTSTRTVNYAELAQRLYAALSERAGGPAGDPGPAARRRLPRLRAGRRGRDHRAQARGRSRRPVRRRHGHASGGRGHDAERCSRSAPTWGTAPARSAPR